MVCLPRCHQTPHFKYDNFCPIPTSLYPPPPESQAPNGSARASHGGPRSVVAASVLSVVRRSFTPNPFGARPRTLFDRRSPYASTWSPVLRPKNVPKPGQNRVKTGSKPPPTLVLPPIFGF